MGPGFLTRAHWSWGLISATSLWIQIAEHGSTRRCAGAVLTTPNRTCCGSEGAALGDEGAEERVLAFSQESAANFVPVNTADDFLHLVLGIAMVGLGLALTRDRSGVAGTTR